jgi:hypothetical protein
MSICEREEVGSGGRQDQGLKSNVIQHFPSDADDDGAHGSSVSVYRC